MGAMFRSDPMSICDIYIQPEVAFEIFSQLGDLGCVQFQDMTPELTAFQRHYMSELCRCADMERKLMYVQSEMIKDSIYVPGMKKEPAPVYPNEMAAYENMFDKFENDIQEMSTYQTELVKNYEELSEMYYVLRFIGPILGDVELRRDSLFARLNMNHATDAMQVVTGCLTASRDYGLVFILVRKRAETTTVRNMKLLRKGRGDMAFGARLYFYTGVVQRKRLLAFETMLWRVSRGNVHFRTVSEDQLFEDHHTGKFVRKVGFLAVCQGEQLSIRLNKICSGFRANTYPCPRTYDDRQGMLEKLQTRIDDISTVLKKSRYHRCKALFNIGGKFNTWMPQVKKSKAIYHNMNLFTLDITTKCLIGQCWVPDRELKAVQSILEKCSEKLGANVPSFISKTTTMEEPPTYHRTNKFTRGFQALISAYGDSVYGEINPGLYTIITFPFLFAVMFGDFCHGTIILLFAIWMVINEKKFIEERSTNEIWNIFFGGRYVILMMGIFTLFTGFIYNDYFSNAAAIKQSYWMNHFSVLELENNNFLNLDPVENTNKPYYLGKDPVWSLARNRIMFENSLKMKMSIILGVIHMMFGLWLSLFNHIHFKRYHAILLEFIPEVLFLACLFMWLVFMIFYKWFNYGAKETDIKLRPGCAPLILILFIDMTLMRTTTVEEPECSAYMFQTQELIQKTLLIIGLVCVPVLLFGTPLYKLRINKKKRIEAQEKLRTFRDSRIKIEGKSRKQELLMEAVEQYSHGFGELMIHQGVHTIEFVLSTISHTASYLRLWALSLAHSELSEMLWNMILSKLALTHRSRPVGPIRIYFVFGVWAVFSLAILVIMEGLSAFLHTLRLHWVEFMSKFYMGGGIVFHPFSFYDILYGDGKEDKGADPCKKKRGHVTTI